MSDNPFDVFATDFQAALPKTNDAEKDKTSAAPINIMAAPETAPVPVMNSAQPPMSEQPAQPAQPPMNGSMTGGMGYGMGMAPGAPMQNNMAPPMNQMGGYTQPPAVGGMAGPPPLNNGFNAMPAPAPGYGQSGPAYGGAMVPSATPSNPYAGQVNPAMNMPPPTPSVTGGSVAPTPAAPVNDFGAPPTPQVPPSNDFGAPPAPSVPAGPGYGAPPAPPVPAANDFGAPPAPPAPAGPDFGAPPVPASNDFGAPPAPPVPASNDFGAPPAPPVPAGHDFGAPPVPATNDFGPTPEVPPTDNWNQPAAGALVPANGPALSDDPFNIFGSGAPAPVPVAPAPAPLAAQPEPWDISGTESVPQQAAPDNSSNFISTGNDELASTNVPSTTEHANNDGELPAGGEWYDARIFTPTLGVMFFKPQELTDSLFLQTDRSLVSALDDRPVVAFIVEGSSARAAGVELGHVLLKVNGIDVKNPKEASRLIKEGPRPLPLLFYVPDTQVVVAEGEHMVKYDTRETGAPNSAKDWKPKYVVIGGIIAQPWMMNMYRSKSEYDIAVIETQARRPVSVKVKQFSLQGARIQNDWQGPQMVKYKNKLHPWKYIVVLPVSRNPIKLSSPNLGQLKPVHEGIRRVLMAQQRHAPASNSAQPVRSDPYGQEAQGGGGYNPQQQYAEPGQHSGAPPPGPYGQAPPQGQGEYGQEGGAYDNAGGVGSARRRQAY